MPNIEAQTAQELEIIRLQNELGETETPTEEATEEEISDEPEVVEELKVEAVVEESPVETEEKEPAKDDHAAWARLRRERADEKRKADTLAQELAELRAIVKAPQQEVKKPNQAPDPETDPEGFLAWKIADNDRTIAELRAKVDARDSQDRQAQAYNAAINEFTNIINDYKTKTPDFDEASNFLENEMRKAIRLQNPTIHASQIQIAVNNQILKTASEFARQGLNPAEEFYSMAHEFGYKKAAPMVAAAPNAKPKTNLNQIDKVKQRSASGLSASGASAQAGIGIEAIEGMTVSDFANLTPAQLRELESQ